MDEKDSGLSIMIIPRIERVRRIGLPNWLVRSVLITLASILILLVAAFNWKASVNLKLRRSNRDQEAKIATLEEKIHHLEELNREKDDVTADLQEQNRSLNKKVDEVETKLKQIDKFKGRLEKLANNKD